ncbi:MAG: RNA polymerase sigma factor RpoH [Pseudomonadales bacterium]
MGKRLQAIEHISPGQNLEAYLQTISTIPVLSVEEERALAERLHDQNDLEAARQLVLSHLRFVVHIARSYSGYGLPLGDLVQEGNVGMMKAVKRFDPSVGVRLVSFAVHWIKAEMHEFILKNWRIVKIATTKAQRKLFFNLRSKKSSLGWMNNEEATLVAEDLGVELKTLREMEGRLASSDTAFDMSGSDDDEGPAFSPSQYLEDHSANPEAVLEDANWQEHSQHKLTVAMQGLDERSRDILAKRWLNDESKATLHDLAAQYSVSAERIRQLEKNAMKKLRDAMTADAPMIA